MSRFTYEAHNSDGNLVSGELSAPTVSAAVRELEQLGLTLRSITLIPTESAQSADELAAFHGHIQELLVNKSRWLPALVAMADELPAGGVKSEMQRLVQRISVDMTAAEFLASRDAHSLVPLFAVGLQSDFSSHRLHAWIDSVSQQVERRLQRRNALAYPVVLTAIVFIVLLLFAIFLVPVFKAMFAEFGLELPTPTMLAIAVSDQFTIHYKRTLMVLLVSGAAIYAIVHVWRGYALTNRIFGRFVAGTSANLAAMSAFTSTLAELLSLKAPLTLALRLAGQSCQHRYFEEASARLATELSTDKRFQGYSPTVRRLPPLVMHALQCGENNKPNVQLLRELSTVYSDRMGARLNLVGDAFPALMTFLIGATVAFIVISLFMPLVSMISSLSS